MEPGPFDQLVFELSNLLVAPAIPRCGTLLSSAWPEFEATEHTSDHVTSSKRATSTRTAISGSASKKARLDDDQMTVLEKELGEVGASRIVLLSVHNFAVCSFCV